jgi:galactitol-specific phosphotransferase system IIB component
MSAVCVLTPLVVASWPVLTSAILGAAATMGFSLQAAPVVEKELKSRKKRVETEIENSEVIADQMGRGQKVVVTRGDITIEFGQDERGACTVCVTGTGHSDAELRSIGEEVAGRVVQQFAYHRLMTELKKRNYSVVDEEMLADQSVRVRLRL